MNTRNIRGWRCLLASAMCLLVALAANGFNKTMHPYELPAGKLGAGMGCTYATAGMKLELGKWYTNWSVCKDYCDKNGIPLVMVWSNATCIHCWYCDVCFIQDSFKEWAATHNAGKVIYCFMAGGDKNGAPDQIGSAAYNWMYYGGGRRLSAYPFCVLWWKKNGVNVRKTGDELCNSKSFTDASIPTRTANIIAEMEAAFAGWAPVEYAGGKMELDETEGNRLEADSGTKEIEIELVRGEDVKDIATNNLVAVVGPDGATKDTVNVAWKKGETKKTVKIDISKAGFTADGQQASLVFKDADGTAQSTNHVTFVEGNSVDNPLWIGERSASGAGLQDASSTPGLAFGEWTMDLDVAKQRVAAAEGDAYTLVAVVGSLWCHDCANTTRNFVDVKDASGNNRLAAWAKANQVALVTVDVPNFSTNSVECASPTLLSRKSYSTQLAFELPEYGMYDVSKGGAPESLTQATARSGLGYLTRKGATDDEALAVLTRNYNLVSKDISEGGFHSGLDSRAYRTGVPIYVLLDKQGNVAARMTRFASVSPLAADKAQWDNIIKRFDEMLAIAKGGEHADGGVWQNDCPSADVAGFKANGGSAAGEISHADAQDVFKLEGVGGNALQKITVTGESDAEVSVQFMKLNAEGKAEKVGEAASGKLSAGVVLEQTFTEAGDFFVKVAGDVAGKDFGATNAKAGNFVPYALSGAVVLVPQETKATGTAADTSDTVTMRLVKDGDYRLQGVDTTKIAGLLNPYTEEANCKFFTALVDGDVEIPLFYGQGGDITYQLWVPCTVGFAAGEASVGEDAGEVKVALARKEGKSGEVTVRVTLDDENTTLYESDDGKKPRFEFEPAEITWKDGEDHETNVVVKVLKEGNRYDGDGVVALKVELVSDENHDTKLATTSFTLKVTEKDEAKPGEVAFADAEPFFSKAQTVFVRAGEGAKIYASRLNASDGAVTVKVNATSGATVEIDGVQTNVISWANHDSADREVTVKGLSAGRSATLTLASPTGGLVLSKAQRKVTVTAVAADGPEFQSPEASEMLAQYVAFSNVYRLASAPAGRVAFAKVSGTLPSGLKVRYNAAENAMAVWGVPTKAGEYTVVYQAKDGSKAGLAQKIDFKVVSPVQGDGEAGVAANGSVAKARSFTGIPVIDSEGKRLAGLLNVTIPTKGSVSAKYKCAAGTISFSAKSWADFDAATGALTAEPLTRTKGYAMTVSVAADGSFEATLKDPAGAALAVAHDGNVWSKTNSAEDWKGYYTVSLPFAGVVSEGREGIAPRGAGYLTLKMNTRTAWNKGEVSWAGKLSNGTAISGKSLLVKAEDDCYAYLPVFARSSVDVFSAYARINAKAMENKDEVGCQAVFEHEDVHAGWTHTERYDETSFQVDLDVFGGLYDSSEDFAATYEVFYPATSPVLGFDLSGLGGWVLDNGVAGEVEDLSAEIGTSTIKIASGQTNAQRATLSFNRSTGIVTGSFKLPYTDAKGAQKTIAAKYAGVVLIGWGEGCGCGPEQVETVLPFVNGSFFFSDKVKSGTRSVTAKRGGWMLVGAGVQD